MESPVRSVEASAGSGEKGEDSAGPKGEPPASHRFEAKSYLERQVEELSCADEDEAQEKVSKRLQLKQERAKKKRDIQLQRRRKGIAERLRKIREAREAVDARFAENAAQLMERQAEKQTSATRSRRRTSLENIKKARAVHNRRVNQRRRESFDESSGLSPARLKSMDEIQSKLERAERNRDILRRERRRRAIERYEEGKARILLHGASSTSIGGGPIVGGCTSGSASVSVEAGRYSRRRRTVEARQVAKARQMQRMRDLRHRLLSRDSKELEGKVRVLAARLLQRWWRCVSKGEPFDSASHNVSSPPDKTPSRQRSTKESPEVWAVVQGLELSLPEGLGSAGVTGDATTGSSQGMRSPLDPCTRSPLQTYRKFSTGVGPEGIARNSSEASGVCGNGGVGGGAAIDAAHDPTSPAITGYGFGSNHDAALTIQSFLRRNLHSLKVANALLAGRLSVKVLCTAVRTMSTSTFDEAIDVMSTRAIVSHCETALKALRMGREMRSVPQTVRSARAFLSALLVNFFPSSALDDEGALSSSPEGTAPLQLEKDRLVRAAGKAVQALVDLETIVDTAAAIVAAATTAGCDSSGGSVRIVSAALTTLGAEQFAKIRRASSTMVRARVAFCRRFAEWKRKDAMRLADEMTAASVDVLQMQLQAERDLHVAAVRYGLDETDDEGALFSTGYEQIKQGTQRQLGKMMHALGKLVGPEEARQRMSSATEAAFERFRAEELAEDEAFLRAAHAASIADEGISTDKEDGNKRGPNYHHSPNAGKSAKTARTTAGAASAATVVEAKAGGEAGESSKSCAESVDAAVQAGKTAGDEEEEDDIAGPRRPLSAGDLLGNEWLVHEVMINEEPLTVSLEEAIENQLLRSGNPAAASADATDKEGRNAYWERVERHVAAEDYTPLLGLVAELRDKIIGLTPRRRDLAAETTEAMDVELLEQMMDYGAFDVGCFFRMIAFAGERVLELEAPIRNEGTKETLAEWGRTQGEVEGGGRRLEPAMVRECFEYLFSKTDEIHVDILNAHLQFVTPFLKQHGVEYERDRFTEKLDGGEISLDMTHLWLHRAIRQLRAAADVASTASSSGPAGSFSSPVLARSNSTSPQSTSVVSQDVLFYRQLLSDLEQKRGDAYLKLLRVAIVDNLLGAIVRVERNKPGPRNGAIGDSGGVSVAEASKAEALASTAAERDDHQEDMLEGVAVPETLALDRYRLVVIAAGAEQAAYTASLVAFARQALVAARVQLTRADENRVRKALMVLFETEDVTSADICAQVAEMTRLIAVSAERALPYNQLSMLTARSRNVLTTGDCPVYKLFLRRTLALLRRTLVEGGLPEDSFEEALRKAGLSDYKEFLLDRVVRPLMVVQRHSEAVFATFYNEIIPLALRTTHAKTLDVD